MKTVKAYHFVGKTLRDGRPIPKNGVWLKHTGKAVMCESGLHASLHPFDALQYAPGNTLCKVELRGIVDKESDKLVAMERRIVARIDAEPLLREFSRACALDYIHLWDAPQVVIDYLKTGDPSLRVAADAAAGAAAGAATGAARAVAEAAAWAATGAARAVAEAAAGAAARAAAEAAARAAAWVAAGAAEAARAARAARAAAWVAADAAARAAGAAARAARAAAEAAARAAQRKRFASMVAKAFKASASA
jgi:hypothetical protein